MHDFDYQSPATLREAIDSLAKSNGRAKPMAGGTDLIDQMRLGRFQPSIVVDIKKIAELNVLNADSHGLRLGAAVPCHRVSEHPVIAQDYAALAEACRIIGGVQIQSRASVGGNLCNSGPAADSTPALIALAASCVIAGPAGTREVPAESFCTGPGKNVLEPGELLVELRFPPPPRHSGSHYRRMIPRNEMDIAVVGVGAAVQLDQTSQRIVAARIGLGAVAPKPLFAQEAAALLVGRPPSDDVLAQAAKAVRAIAAPISDMRGTIEYRLHVTEVLVRRVLQTALARARGEAAEYRPGH